jgi:hypothetical protein
MKYFLYALGIITWLLGLIDIARLPPAYTVFQELSVLGTLLNGTLMVVGAAIIGAIDGLKSKVSAVQVGASGPRQTGDPAIDAAEASANTWASSELSDNEKKRYDKPLKIIAVAVVVFAVWAGYSAYKNRGATTPSAATSAGPTSVTGSPHIDSLIAKYDEADQACREGSQPACRQRDETAGPDLNRVGWCFGKRGQGDGERQWHLCTPQSRRF